METPMQQNTYEQYEEPVNYIGAIIGAVIGGVIVVALWAAGVYYLQMIEYRLLALAGALVGGGAILASRTNNWKIGLIALLVAAVTMLAGDYIQMMYVSGRNSLEIDDYIRFSEDMLSENAMQYGMYLISVGVAFFVGTFGNRSGAQVIASRGK